MRISLNLKSATTYPYSLKLQHELIQILIGRERSMREQLSLPVLKRVRRERNVFDSKSAGIFRLRSTIYQSELVSPPYFPMSFFSVPQLRFDEGEERLVTVWSHMPFFSVVSLVFCFFFFICSLSLAIRVSTTKSIFPLDLILI